LAKSGSGLSGRASATSHPPSGIDVERIRMRSRHTRSPASLPGSASSVHSALPPAIITISQRPSGVSTNVRHPCSASIWRVSGLDGLVSCVPFAVTLSPTFGPEGAVVVVVVVVGDDFFPSPSSPQAANASATTATATEQPGPHAPEPTPTTLWV
jgi:hypothetical protein